MNILSQRNDTTIFDLSSKRAPRVIGSVLFLLSICYIAVFLFDVEPGEKISLGILLFGLISFFFLPKSIWFKPPLILMVLSILWLVAAWAVVSSDFPDRARSGPAVEDFIDKFLFLFIGLALAGSRYRERVFAAVLGAVIVLLPWISGDGFSALMAGLQGHREGFGLNPIRSGMLATFVFMFASVFLLFEVFSERKRKAVMALAAVAVVWSLILVSVSQTRAVFVALLVVLITGVPFVLHRIGVMQNRAGRKKFLIIIAIALMALVSLDYGLGGKNIDRIKQGFSIIPLVATEGVDELPQSSWGIRVIMLNIGLEQSAERPFWGWGYRSSDLILEDAHSAGVLDQEFSQFHNSYLEVLVEYGIVGVVLLLAVFLYLLSRLVALIRPESQDLRLATASFLFLLFMLVFSFFDGILVQGSYGQFIFNAVGGVALSLHFRRAFLQPADVATAG
ncbi:O-antigen ligase family protein [Marinobacter confluentis]|uniref:O-antigen ligase family protein n=1 Tax=Marinobacter confluentis TaxID=1697557 RepID=A0A4Z1BA10_9GAMM|nr:O-antigen ligase family protein [Marinobacter confluentis]TGN38523.1 O-antigen ligase family protein [Marinobacter confluentis]